MLTNNKKIRAKFSRRASPSLLAKLFVFGVFAMLFVVPVFAPSSLAGHRIWSQQCDTYYRQLWQNTFQIGRDLGRYRAGFTSTFSKYLADLRGNWFDGGAGFARAMIDYLRSHTVRDDQRIIAYSFKKPERAKDPQFFDELVAAEELFSKVFEYREGDFTKSDPTKFPQQQLITDIAGIFTYVTEPNKAIDKYLRMLAPGGRVYLCFAKDGFLIFNDPKDLVAFNRASEKHWSHQGARRVENKPEKEDFANPSLRLQFFSAIKGAKLLEMDTSDEVEIRVCLERTSGEVSVPELEQIERVDRAIIHPSRSFVIPSNHLSR